MKFAVAYLLEKNPDRTVMAAKWSQPNGEPWGVVGYGSTVEEATANLLEIVLLEPGRLPI